MRVKADVLSAAAILTGILAMMLPLRWPQAVRVADVRVEIIATGEFNPAARGSEVWLETIEGADIAPSELFPLQPG